MKLKLIILIFALFAQIAFSQKDSWVIRINKEQEVSPEDYNLEFSYFAKTTGLKIDQINVFYQSEQDKIAFLQKISENELIYMESVDKKYDKKKDVIKKYEDQKDTQLVQLYLFNIININQITVSEEEKQQEFRKNKKNYEKLAGRKLKYSQVENEMESIIFRKKFSTSYQEVINKAREKYGVELSIDKKIVASIGGDKAKIERTDLDARIAEMEEAGLITPANRAQADTLVLNDMVSQELVILMAKDDGYYKSEEAEAFLELIKKKVIIEEYLTQEIKNEIPEPTEEELNEAYKQYGKQYNIDTVPCSQAKKILTGVINQTKYRTKYQILYSRLLEENRVERQPENIQVPPENIQVKEQPENEENLVEEQPENEENLVEEQPEN